MKKNWIQIISAVLIAAPVIVAGCSKSVSEVKPLSADKIPAAVNQTFNQSSDVSKQLASGYISDFQNRNIVAAFNDLQKLRRQTNLTQQQREIAARVWMTTIKQLHAAADGGDPAAQAALHQYLTTR